MYQSAKVVYYFKKPFCQLELNMLITLQEYIFSFNECKPVGFFPQMPKMNLSISKEEKKEKRVVPC